MDGLRMIATGGVEPVRAGAPGVGNAARAAAEFEALLIATMLKASREAGSSWLGTGDDAAGESAIGFAEEHLARTLASQGGLGIAHLLMRGLENQKRPYAEDKAAASDIATTAAGNSGSGV